MCVSCILKNTGVCQVNMYRREFDVKVFKAEGKQIYMEGSCVDIASQKKTSPFLNDRRFVFGSLQYATSSKYKHALKKPSLINQTPQSYMIW